MEALLIRSEITGLASNWLAVNGIWNVGGNNYIINLIGSPDDDNLSEGTFVVSVTDESGLSSSVGYSVDIVPVNDIPIITDFIGDTLFNEDTQLAISIYDFLVNDPDNTFPGDFVLQGINVEDGENYQWDGQFIIPDSNYFGSLTVPVSVNDGVNQSSLFTLDLFVSPLNDPPVYEITTLENVVEDTLYTMPIYFSDVDGTDDIDTYTITASGGN